MNDLRDAVSFHQLLLSANDASALTLAHYATYQTAFIGYLADVVHVPPVLDELNVKRVSEFLIWYRQLKQGPRTRGGEVACKEAAKLLKRLGAVLEENEYVETNPLAKLRLPRVAKYLRQPFTQTEIGALWGACFRTQAPARDEALFLLLLDTGMRIGEATGLRIDHVDLEQERVVVFGKGRREREISIAAYDDQGRWKRNGRVVRSLKRYLHLRREPREGVEPYLFLARDGRALAPDGGYEVIKHLGELAGIDDVYPHRFRHTFCSHYLTEHDGDEQGLMRIVGHLNKDVMADYVHLAAATVARRKGRISLAETWLSGPRMSLLHQHSGAGPSDGLPGAAADLHPRKSRPLAR